MKTLRIHVSGIAAAAIALTFLIFSAATIVAGENHENAKSLLISWNLNFTGSTTADGTSTIAGAYADEGTRHEDFTVNVQGDHAIVSGTIVIHATKGDLTEKFVGTIPLGPNPTLIEGTGVFTGGTGAYTGITGRATFEGTVNFATGKLVGVTEGKVQLR